MIHLLFSAVAWLAAVLLLVMGGRLLITGTNPSGWLGRGFTQGDNLRLARAPSSYFRALGSMMVCFGLLGALAGLAGPGPYRVSGAGGATILFLVGLGLLGLIASASWKTVLSAKHGLFRWNKP